MKTKLYFYFLLLLFLGSCGTSKSVKYIPDYQKYSLEIPQIQKLNDSTFSFKETPLDQLPSLVYHNINKLKDEI